MEQKHLNIDNDFRNWISTLKKDIRQAQIKAAVKVNSELLHLYWHLGEEIARKQKLATWGDGWLNWARLCLCRKTSAPLSSLIPTEIQSQLPTIEEIEKSL